MVRIWIVGVVSAALVYYPAGLRAQHRTSEYYNAWLNEDVAYIVTDEERAVFGRLNSDEERDQFIEQFWFRRDPTPDTLENEFKEEHYRRMAYANEHFACALPGWHADRGRIYIAVGPPDEIQLHPSVVGYDRPPDRVEEELRCIRSSSGLIAISRVWAKTSCSNSSITRSQANIAW